MTDPQSPARAPETFGLVALQNTNHGEAFAITLQHMTPIPVLQNLATRYIFRNGFERALLLRVALGTWSSDSTSLTVAARSHPRRRPHPD